MRQNLLKFPECNNSRDRSDCYATTLCKLQVIKRVSSKRRGGGEEVRCSKCFLPHRKIGDVTEVECASLLHLTLNATLTSPVNYFVKDGILRGPPRHPSYNFRRGDFMEPVATTRNSKRYPQATINSAYSCALVRAMKFFDDYATFSRCFRKHFMHKILSVFTTII